MVKSDMTNFILIFIGIIIAATMIAPIADSVIGVSQTIILNNNTVTIPVVNGTLDLEGKALIETIEFYNATGTDDWINNVTISTQTGSNGLRTVQLTINDSYPALAGQSANISYTANPDGYLGDSGSRSVMVLVILFAALAIVVFALVSLWKSDSLKNLMRN